MNIEGSVQVSHFVQEKHKNEIGKNVIWFKDHV